jgi:radical SAM superfamily enzyme YgiQ (UPF0313 family)
MRILFVTKSLGQEPMGPMYLSRTLKDAGHECRALFLPSSRDILRDIRAFAPDLLCYSPTTGLHRYYLAANRYIRQHYQATSVFGGIHSTFMPSILENDKVDAVCVGEGESAFLEFVSRLAQGESARDVANFHVKEDGEIFKNSPRTLVQDLDTLGFPDRELIYANPFYANNKYKVFMTSRGCVARCHYCFHSGYGKTYDSMPGKYLRRRSVEHVLAEIEDVRRRWPLGFIHFTDDMFNFNRTWQEEFLSEYRRRVGIPFSVIFMIDWITPDLLKLYREAGCVNLRIAFETADDTLKADLNRFKSSPTADQMKAAELVRAAGIRLTTLNMIGIPGGTLDNEMDTLRMNLAAKPKQVLVNFLHPYPGTSLDGQLAAHGLHRKPYDEYEVAATRSLPVDLPDKERLEKLHHLFPLVIRMPWLMSFLPALISIPGRLVNRLYMLVFGVCMEWQYVTLVNCTKQPVLKPLAVGFDLAQRLTERLRAFARQVVFQRRHPMSV